MQLNTKELQGVIAAQRKYIVQVEARLIAMAKALRTTNNRLEGMQEQIKQASSLLGSGQKVDAAAFVEATRAVAIIKALAALPIVYLPEAATRVIVSPDLPKEVLGEDLETFK